MSNQKELQEIVQSNAWQSIEQLLQERIEAVENITDLDTMIDPTVLAIEIRSRQLAAVALKSFLSEIEIYKSSPKKKQNIVMRSFR